MAKAHPALRAVLDLVDGHTAMDAFTRQRGGMAQGVAWAEVAGRLRDGSFAEMRLHYWAATGKLAAGLLIYQPMARGGRTAVFGEIKDDGQPLLEDGQARVAEAMRDWLDKLEEEL